jgi:hypothetical protein
LRFRTRGNDCSGKGIAQLNTAPIDFGAVWIRSPACPPHRRGGNDLTIRIRVD